MTIESRQTLRYVKVIGSGNTKRLTPERLIEIAHEFLVGNFEHKDHFIENYISLAISMGSRYQTVEHNAEDSVGTALLTLCELPEEIHSGRYKFDIPIDNYVKTRIKSKCINEMRKQFVLRISTRAVNKGVMIHRKTVVYPGEKIGNVAAKRTPVTIFNVLACKPDIDNNLDIDVTLNVGERHIINRIIEDYTLEDIARDFGVSVKTIKRRLIKLWDKLCVSENFSHHPQ